jgi:hypothetical protein
MNNPPTKGELVLLLKAAVNRFNKSIDRETLLAAVDYGLEHQVSLFRVAHEQAISHRLAFYIESILRAEAVITDKGPLVVDCEYSHHLFDRKKICVLASEAGMFLKARRSAISIEGRSDAIEFEIRPDVLIHKRGVDGPTNLLVLEVKRWTNPDKAHDSQKLKLLTKLGLNAFGYVLGAAVYARNDFPPKQRVLEVGLCLHDGQPCQ